MEIAWLLPLIALAELVGDLLHIDPIERTLGALKIVPVMVGILLANLIVDIYSLVLVLPFGAIFIWILREQREKFKKSRGS